MTLALFEGVQTIALIHILAGMLAVTAGAVALSVKKGAKLHRKSGKIFVYAMLFMAAGGATLAARKLEMPLHRGNFVAALLTIYFVTTALFTVRRRDRASPWIDAFGLALASVIGAICFKFAFDGLLDRKGNLTWFPAVPMFVFGTVALLSALGDARLVAGRVLEGPRRIARHLWRMGFAMFIATGSFFLGQAKVFPEAIRIVPLLAVPVLLVIAATIYWWVRVSIMKRLPRAAASPA